MLFRCGCIKILCVQLAARYVQPECYLSSTWGSLLNDEFLPRLLSDIKWTWPNNPKYKSIPLKVIQYIPAFDVVKPPGDRLVPVTYTYTAINTHYLHRHCGIGINHRFFQLCTEIQINNKCVYDSIGHMCVWWKDMTLCVCISSSVPSASTFPGMAVS